MEHHSSLSPSSLPMKNKCAKFKSAPAGDAANQGNILHEAFARMLDPPQRFEEEGGDFESIEDFEMDGLRWAVDYVRCNMTSAHPIASEQKVSYMDADFRELFFGTVDVLNGDVIFDLKTGETRSYWYQMAAYALACMENTSFDQMTVHILYSRYRKAHTYVIEKWVAAAAIGDLVNRIKDPNSPAIPSEYCAWCSESNTCSALALRANEISKEMGWGLDSYNKDAITDPGQLGKAVRLAKIMAIWADGILKMSREHETIEGYEWRETRGRKTMKNIMEAKELLGLPFDEVLGACSLSITKLEKIIAAKTGVHLKDARKVVEDTLKDLIKVGEPIRKLTEIKEDNK